MKINNILLWIVILAIAGWLGWSVIQSEDLTTGGVTVGNEYTATTTKTITGVVESKSIKNGWGSLGSVIVTEAGDIEYLLIDASSTVMDWDNFPTSTRMLADIPTTLVAGTYIFDVMFNHGLYLDIVSGSTGTSTLTFR